MLRNITGRLKESVHSLLPQQQMLGLAKVFLVTFTNDITEQHNFSLDQK